MQHFLLIKYHQLNQSQITIYTSAIKVFLQQLKKLK